MKYDAEVVAAIAQAARARRVTFTPPLVHAVIEKESTHGRSLVTDEGPDPKTGRRRYSYGPMMVLDSTASGEYGIADPSSLARDPGLGIRIGVDYLARQAALYPGDPARAIAGYNYPAGAKRGRDAAGKFANQAYVDAVLGFWNRFKVAARAAAPGAALVVAGLLAWWFLARRPARAAR